MIGARVCDWLHNVHKNSFKKHCIANLSAVLQFFTPFSLVCSVFYKFSGNLLFTFIMDLESTKCETCSHLNIGFSSEWKQPVLFNTVGSDIGSDPAHSYWPSKHLFSNTSGSIHLDKHKAHPLLSIQDIIVWEGHYFTRPAFLPVK